MSRKQRQAGEGKLGCIIWTLILALVVMAGWKMIPVKIATSELYDFMVEQAKWAATTPPDRLAKAILEEAKRLDLPVAPENIRVVASTGRVKMQANFTVPIDFPVRTYNWEFNLEVDRPVFSF